MTYILSKNNSLMKSEGISVGQGLTGEMGSGGDFVPIGMPGAYNYKVQRKEKEKDNELNI